MAVYRSPFGVTSKVTQDGQDQIDRILSRWSDLDEEVQPQVPDVTSFAPQVPERTQPSLSREELEARLGISSAPYRRESAEVAGARRDLDEERAALEAKLGVSYDVDKGMFDRLKEQLSEIGSPVKAMNPFQQLLNNPITNKVKEVLPDSWVSSISDANNAVGDWIGYAVGTPARFVESAAKELADIGNAYDFETGQFFDADKDQFSFVDFFKQGFDPDFDPVYAPVEAVGKIFDRDWSENGFVTGVDSVLNIGAKVVADPITYTGLSPVRYGGRAGRAALADDLGNLLRRENISQADLAAELSNVYRYGEFGLSPQSRNLLVVAGKLDPQGIRWAGRVVPNTGAAQQSLGRTLTTTRAEIGDKAPFDLAMRTTPQSLKGLAQIARGADLTPEQTLGAFAVHSANKFAQGESAKVINAVSSEYKNEIKQLSDTSVINAGVYVDDFGEQVDGWTKINNFMEGVSDDIPEELRPLAEAARATYDSALARINANREALNEAYDLGLPPITRLDNYVHRTLSRDARSARAALRGKRRDAFDRAAKELGITPEKLTSNEGFTMARSKTGTFLGEKLRNDSIAEYNRIALDKLGYKFFEDNSGVVLKNYLDSFGKQMRREYFVSDLLKRYPQGINRFLGSGTGKNAKVTTPKGVRSLIESMTTDIDRLTKEVVIRRGAGSLTGEVLAQVRQVRDGLVAQGAEAFKSSTKVAARSRAAARKLRQRAAELAEAEEVAREKGADAMREFDALARPLLRRAELLATALEADQSAYDVAMRWLRQKHEAIFPQAVSRPTTAEGLADEILGDAQSRLRGAARRNVERKAKEARAAGVRRGREVEVDGVTMKVTAAKKELKTTRKQYEGAKRAFDKFSKNDPAFRGLRRAESNFNRAAASFDAASALAGSVDEWNRIVGDAYRADIQSVTDLIRTAPKSGDSLDMNVEWVRKVETTLANLEALDVPEGQKEALRRVFAQLFADEGHLSRIDALVDDLPRLQAAEDRMVAEILKGEWVEDLQDGWTALANLHVQISPEIKEQVGGLYQDLDELFLQLKDPTQLTRLGELYRITNGYFKTTALLTVGYSVRNAFTAAFNNWSMGVTNGQMGRGVKFANRVRQVGYEKALAEIKDAGARKIMEDAYTATQMSGGGNFIDEAFPRLGREQRKYDNAVANTVYRVGDYVFRPFAGRLSQKARALNENVELMFRMGMAINGIEQGLSPQAAAGRIARVQFDYTDLSDLDEAVKLVIPFWVFASRNLPLQITNRVLRPSAYNVYDTIAEYDDELSEDLPFWRARRNPLKLPFGEWYLDLDLPFQSLSSSLEEFTTLRGIAGQASPILRSPAEAIFGQRIAFGDTIPYSDDLRPAGLDLPLALLTGQLSRDAEGRLVTSDRAVEPIKGALPAFSNLQKYLQSIAGLAFDDEGKEDMDAPIRQVLGGSGRMYDREFLNSLFQATGLGAFRLTEPMKEGELRRRRYDIRDIADELKQLGYTE